MENNEKLAKKIGEDEIVEINIKHTSVSDKNNNSEPVLNDEIGSEKTSYNNPINNFLGSYYSYSILVSSLYSFIIIGIKTEFILKEYFLDFIINFISISIVALILSFIVDIFAPKGGRFIRIYFWTLLISSFIVIVGSL